MTAAPGLVGVVVPARDEEHLLGRCLDSLALAARSLRAVRPRCGVRVVVVLDGCTDGSEQVVRRHAWTAGLATPQVVPLAPSGVGVARARGAERVLAGSGLSADNVWLAFTDADSTVPEEWLLAQVRAAEQGWDAWVGTVALDIDAPAPSTTHASGATTAGSARVELAHRWDALIRREHGHAHVHGANLGVRASAYRAVGGIAPIVSGEDVALVHALRQVGAALLRTPELPVTTSARTVGRAPGGVAVDLALLAAQSA